MGATLRGGGTTLHGTTNLTGTAGISTVSLRDLTARSPGRQETSGEGSRSFFPFEADDLDPLVIPGYCLV